jgi:phosphate transport system substrate-binding protein
VIAGSTSVQPLSELLAETFMEGNEAVRVEVQGGGSGQGLKAVREGVADIGALSRTLKADERTEISEEIIIAIDGIGVIANEGVGVDALTKMQLRQIFKGEIKNWRDVGGKDLAVVVVAREEGSGTRTAFCEIAGVMENDGAGGETDGTTPDALIQGSTGAVRQTVAGTEGAVGYISLGALDGSVAILEIEGVVPSHETVRNGEYPLARPFLYVTGGPLSPEAAVWIDFVLSEQGQAVVTAAGFVPVAG